MTKSEMILQALIEYEENNYEMEDDEWQKQINSLISDYKNKVRQEGEQI